jgi:signal peptidase I
MNWPRISWWQCGLIGGVTISVAPLMKIVRSVPWFFTDPWGELLFVAEIFAMGFVCGALVGVLWRLSKRRAAGVILAAPFAVRTSPQPPRLRPMQFGMRGLLIAVALCAVALGMGRWLWYFVCDRPHLEVLVQATEARGAMEPTLNGREILVADMNAYWKAKPARWEIVVFRLSGPNTGRVLRVIGLPGETVSFAGGKVVINGQPVVPPRHLQNLRYHCNIPDAELVPHPYTVPDGCYYVLGDNPDKAKDSRLWGGLPEAEIVGRYPYVGGGAQRE